MAQGNTQPLYMDIPQSKGLPHRNIGYILWLGG